MIGNTKFDQILDKLDVDIDKLVEKYGMTQRIEKINEEWTDLMYSFKTDYRGKEDDNAFITIATDIYREITNIKQYNSQPLYERLQSLKLGVAATGADASREDNNIALKGEISELKSIHERMVRVHSVTGKFKKGVLYFNQLQGRNLFHLGIIPKDMSNKALGIVHKRKRSNDDDVSIKKKSKWTAIPFDFYLDIGKIVLVGTQPMFNSLIPLLTTNHINYTIVDGDMEINSKFYNLLVENDILGKTVLKKEKAPPVPKVFVSRRFKVYIYNDKPVIFGKKKHVQKLRTKMGIKRKISSGNDDSDDMVVINNKVQRKNAESVMKFSIDSVTKLTLPEKYNSLLYQLYPSLKPYNLVRERPTPEVFTPAYSFYTYDNKLVLFGQSKFINLVRPRITTLKRPTDITDESDDLLLVINLTQQKVVQKFINIDFNTVEKTPLPEKYYPLLYKNYPALVVNTSSKIKLNVYTYDNHIIFFGKRKDIDKIRPIFSSLRKANVDSEDGNDLLLITTTAQKKNIEKRIKRDIDTMNKSPLPERYYSLLYTLYPSLKPKNDELSLDFVMEDFPVPDNDNMTMVPFKEFKYDGDMTDWYHFRGIRTYQSPWTRHMASIAKNNISSTAIYNPESFTDGIFHVDVKRKSSWIRLLENKCTKLYDGIFLPEEFRSFIIRNLHTTQYIAFTLAHEFSANSRHANAMIIDTVNKNIVRFEPHGRSTPCYDMELCDRRLINAFKVTDELKGYKYISPIAYQSIDGPQSNETVQKKYARIYMEFGSKTRLAEASGFCLAWTMLFQYYWVTNGPLGYTHVDIKKHLTKHSDELATIIRQFQAWVVTLSKKYYDKLYKPGYIK